MKYIGLILTFFICSVNTLTAQYSRYIVQLKDKQGSTYNINQPSGFLSPKALQRRTRYNLSIDSTDLPVSKIYLDAISSIGNVTIISTSKWLNQVLIQSTDNTVISKINRLYFVNYTSPAGLSASRNIITEDKFKNEKTDIAPILLRSQAIESNALDYGQSFGQIHLHEGEYLHNLGFTGEGITIAIMDAGFLNFNTIKAFDSIRKNNQIKGVWDFVAREASVSEDNAHGMNCLSIIAANIPGTLVGTAPKSSFYLFRTEDDKSEYPIEEHHWAVAAEQADSLGADMISSSLGYSVFDDPMLNYTYADMNGDSTMVTKAADLAAKKGMIVCNSAGNSGNDPWKYIIAPADGDSVLAIGATDVNGSPSSFSSYGPSSDGRVKPDVASVGQRTFLIDFNGNLAFGSGTSFSNPNLAGLIACLWQAFPEFSNMKIIEALKKSAGSFNKPDNRIGFGIPNMRLAYEWLLAERIKNQTLSDELKIFPNPFKEGFIVNFKALQNGSAVLQLMDAAGRIIETKNSEVTAGQNYQVSFNRLEKLQHGMYYLILKNGALKKSFTLLR